MRIIEFSTYIVGKKILKMVSNTKNSSDTIISVVLLQKLSVNVYIVLIFHSYSIFLSSSYLILSYNINLSNLH